MKHNEMNDFSCDSKVDEELIQNPEALSDDELDKVSGGYNENEYNKTDCENRRTWNLSKCAFCTRLVIKRGAALCDGVMCNTVDYFCMYDKGHGSLMCTHWSLPTGETVKIKVYEKN